MKRFASLYVAAAFLLALGSCSTPGPRNVEMPTFTATNTTSIDVRGVELTDSSTVLNLHATFRPGWWISIDSATTIRAEGKEYRLIGSSDNFKIGEHFTLPESGEDDFTLVFEPIPFDTESIDLDENTDQAFKIWGIDVTGKKSGFAPQLTSSLPKDVRNIDTSNPFVDPVMEVAPTEITFQVLDYRPEYGTDLSVLSFALPDVSTSTVKLDENGKGTMQAILYGPTKFYVSLDGTPSETVNGIMVAPGVDTEIFIDPAYSSDLVMSKRPGMDKQAPVRVYDNGKYAAINLISARSGNMAADGKEMTWRITPDEFIDNIVAVHKASLDSLESKDIPEPAKAFFKANIDGVALMSAADAVNRLQYMYYVDKGSAVGMQDSVNVNFTPEHYARVAAIANPESLDLFVFSSLGHVMSSYDWGAIGEKGKLLHEGNVFLKLYEKSKGGLLTDEDLEQMKDASLPFFVDALKTRQQETLDIEKRLKEKIASLPDDAPEKFFQNIIDKYKGKVVLVDLWNTWCGPCRNALKANEPLKGSTLSDPDIVWVYIADQSSDLAQYEKMIPNIKGEHYMANEEQIKAIHDRFQVDGIPFYILVDRQGNAVRHPDFRNHELMIEEIKKQL